jgi:hypothetical protein
VQAGYSQVRNDNAWAHGNGVIGLLVCLAGLALLFVGRYPAACSTSSWA